MILIIKGRLYHITPLNILHGRGGYTTSPPPVHMMLFLSNVGGELGTTPFLREGCYTVTFIGWENNADD